MCNIGIGNSPVEIGAANNFSQGRVDKLAQQGMAAIERRHNVQRLIFDATRRSGAARSAFAVPRT
jgi:hypothetical protein